MIKTPGQWVNRRGRARYENNTGNMRNFLQMTLGKGPGSLNTILRVKTIKESNLLRKYFTVLDDIELYLEKKSTLMNTKTSDFGGSLI